jgi:hypothetical protein
MQQTQTQRPVKSSRKIEIAVVDCRENHPANPVQGMIRQIENEAYNGRTSYLLAWGGFCLRHEADTELITEKKQRKLRAIAVKMADKIESLERLLDKLKVAVEEAKTLHQPGRVKEILGQFQVTEEEKKSKKIRQILEMAEQAYKSVQIDAL